MKDKITWQSKGSDVIHTIPAHAVVVVHSEKSTASIEIDGDNVLVKELAYLNAGIEKFTITVGLSEKNQEEE